MKSLRLLSILLVGSVLLNATASHADDPTKGLPEVVAKRHAQTYINDNGDGDCQNDVYQGPQSFDLGSGYKLHLVSCFNGAYQGSSRGYITQEGNPDVKSLSILGAAEGSGVSITQELGDAEFDAKKGILSTHTKARGIGDCGESSQTSISAKSYLIIKPLLVNAKMKCDGKYTAWPTVFKQKK